MESMDYNYFSNTGPHQFTYLNYGADAGLLSNGGNGLGGQDVRAAVGTLHGVSDVCVVGNGQHS